MGTHDGHRERLRTTFLENGLDCFNELNSLELLLFYAIPRKDTNEIAHALLDRFGSLDGIFDASFYELCEVEGIGEQAASLIKLVPQIVRKSKITRANRIKQVTNSTAAGQYFLPRFMDQREEMLLLLCLDSQKRIISCTEICRGVVNSVETDLRKVAETALKCRASSVIIAHNHPDGYAIPSREDDITTKMISDSLSALGIPLIDHIIVADDAYVSIFDTGMLKSDLY